jgi:polyvinyl alcohol dehydrogenase (cytochrome)
MYARLRSPALVTVIAALAVPTVADGAGDWPSYGFDLLNSRSQVHAGGISAKTAPRLVERWARRGVGGKAAVTGTPAVVGGTAYYADWYGKLYAVSIRDGHVRWSTKLTPDESVAEGVWSSPTVSGGAVYVSPLAGRVVAVSARTGRVRWSRTVDTHEFPGMQATPVVYGRSLIIGVSSSQNFVAKPPYDFRGSVLALDKQTGKTLWQTDTIPADSGGTGGSVWGTVAIDRRRGWAFVGTGQAYAQPAAPLTDSLLALRLRDGKVVWHRQFTANDVWNVLGGGFFGKDYDLGASPNLFRIGHRDVVGVGDKGGRFAVLDRRSGATIWRRKLCSGSHFGGIMTTAAVARGSIWVTCNTLSATFLTHPDFNDLYFDFPESARPVSHTDIFRLDAASGRTHWRKRVPAITFGAVTEAGGVVFVPNTDGTFRAFDGRSGQLLWKSRPGAPLGGGATVAGDTVLIGYGVQFGLADRALHPPAKALGGIVAYTLRK